MKNKKHFWAKLNMTLMLVVFASLSLFSFKPEAQYTMVNPNVIKNANGDMYQVGMVNLMFREHPENFTSRSFGVQGLDELISNYNIDELIQRYPLKEDRSKRLPGDENVARIFTIKYSSNMNPEELSALILRDYGHMFEWVEPEYVYELDYYIPNDPTMNAQWHIWKVMAPEAWGISKGDTNVIIAIVDSGSDLDHPDLQANTWINWAEYPPNGMDSDGNGFIDDWIGWDFGGTSTAGPDNDPQIYGSNCDHGSHVAGCASQVTDNGVHGAGVGFNCKLMISKHGRDDDFSGAGGSSLIYFSNDGLFYGYQNGAKVINCSFGSTTFSGFTQTIIENAWNAGTIVVASAGNQSSNSVRYPASYNLSVSVAASNQNDVKAGFSNWHTTVDVIAPGQSILSTLWNDTYASLSGTSMSAPITSGIVGLIWSQNPNWTPQQVVDRLKMSIDSIYQIPGNAPYIGLLGTGRVNALKALTDDPIFAITSVSHNDSIFGNNDGVYDIGEIIPVKLDLKNTWLGRNDVSIRLETDDPDVEIVVDSVYLGNVSEFGTVSTNFNNTFQVRAKETCPFDKVVTFRMIPSSSSRVSYSESSFSITFRQGFAIHDANFLKLALTKDGAVGKKTEPYGSGLQLGSSTVNHIYEGGLMIGINENQVSDVVRRGSTPANVSDTDFVALKTYSITTPGVSATQDGIGGFNDDGAGSSKIGVTVDAYSYASSLSGNENFIILNYKISNTSGAALNNVHAGIYMMFNPNGAFSANMTDFNAGSKIAYTFNNGSPDPYLGISLLSSQNLNVKILPATEMFTGFTSQKKWDALSNGTNTSAMGPSPNAFVISAGPFNLQPGEYEHVGFAVLAATNLNDLLAFNTTAQNFYSSVSVNMISEIIPERFDVSQNYPNPFNPVTTIKFSVPQQDHIKMRVFDALGREVAVLLNESFTPGEYEVRFDGSILSSGVYYYRFESTGLVTTKKMLLIK